MPMQPSEESVESSMSGPATLPAGLVAELRMGTTVATNALLERRGEPLVLAIMRGVGDPYCHHGPDSEHRPDVFSRLPVLT